MRISINRLIACLFSLAAIFSAAGSGKVAAPDFAFPQKVSETANADLQKAMIANDAPAAMDALIRLYIADRLVDPASAQTSIRKVEEAAHKMSASDFSPMFSALLARMYSNFYNADRWKYNRREQPLTPLPEDLTEWSGDQFRSKISELCKASISPKLAALKTADYPGLVACSKTSLPYYPTLLDFAYVNALNAQSGFPDFDAAALCKEAEAAATSTAPCIVWTINAIDQEGYNVNNVDAYLRLYQKYSESPYSAVLLERYADAVANSLSTAYNENKPTTDEQENRAANCVCMLDSFIAKHSSSPFVPNLRQAKANILAGALTASYSSLSAPGIETEITVTSRCTNKGNILVYRFNSAPKYSWNGHTNLKNATLVKTMPVAFEGKAPFVAKTTLKIKLDKPGYYAFVATQGTKPISNSYSAQRCVPVLPIAMACSGTARVAVCNPITGQPIEGASVYLTNREESKAKRILAGVTDANGVVDVSDKIAQTTENIQKQKKLEAKGFQTRISDHFIVSIGFGSEIYPFNDVWISESYPMNGKLEEEIISILTDRSIYHRGDTIRFLAIYHSAKRDDFFAPNISGTIADKQVKLVLNDANSKEVNTFTGTTDAYGRVSGFFVAPSDGLTGSFSIYAYADKGSASKGSAYFTVSDYRMPDFKITAEPAMLSTPKPGWVTIKGTATSYAGAPMAGTSVQALLKERPRYVWWVSPSTPYIYSAEATTDADGSFSIEIPDSVFNAHPDQKSYFVSLDATSLSGSTATESLCFSTGKQYQLEFGFLPTNIDGAAPFTIPVNVKNTAGGDANIELGCALLNDSTTVASGNVLENINLSSITPGRYTLKVYPLDPSLADTISTSVSIYNANTNIVPGSSPIWVVSRSESVTIDAKTMQLLIGANLDSASVYLSTIINNKWREFKRLDITKGYHNISIDCSGLLEGMVNQVRLIALNDFETFGENVIINIKGPQPLQMVGESFRDNLTAGQTETWKIRLTNADGSPAQAALVLDMFNDALSALRTHKLSLSNVRLYSPTPFNYDNAFKQSFSTVWWQSQKSFSMAALAQPHFNFYGVNPSLVATGGIYIRGTKNMALAKSTPNEDELVYSVTQASVDSSYNIAVSEDAAAEEESAADEDGGQAQDPDSRQAADFDYRDSDVPLAVWAPMLTTDAEGNISYSFTVPNANTTWQLLALAWTKDVKTASLMRTFVASKPIMVMPNAPRFLRAGDVCMVPAQIVNYTDKQITATTVVEIFNPANGSVISSQKFKSAIEPKGSAVVTAKVTAPADIAALGYRVRTSNGQFADGEQSAIPVLPSEARLVESYPFYLNPADTLYSTTLPKEKGARLSLTFTENPVWTVVSALPGLRKDAGNTANSAAAAIFSASIAKGIVKSNPTIAKAIKTWAKNPADSALASMLEKNEDLKIALLNSTPWVQAAQSEAERMARLSLIFNAKETDAAINAAVATLSKLQCPDGGWAWAPWYKQSSEWTTANVLSMFADLKTYGYMPDNKDLQKMVDRAVAYYDDCMLKALNRATDKKSVTNELYAIVRPRVSDAYISLAGQTVIANTTYSIAQNWKTDTDPASKAMAAMALYVNDYKTLSKEIMASVSQFGVWSKDQGLRFPSVNALYNYAILLDAYAMIEPQSKEVDGLRQQLIVRKQGDDWGSAVVTTEVVASLLSSGSKWTVDAQGATIEADGKEVRPSSQMQQYTGAISADLSPYAGKKLTISTSASGPAYGAVFAQFKKTMTDVKAASCPDLDIEKTMTVRRGTKWEHMPKTLKVGDRVKVQLTIHCKRNLSYVTITDQRPAAFQPADQLPGWLYSEGVAFYRENGDSATNLYVVQMSPGTYILTYEMNVGQAGTYSSGVASIQSQYAPELTAHSSGSPLKVE